MRRLWGCRPCSLPDLCLHAIVCPATLPSRNWRICGSPVLGARAAHVMEMLSLLYKGSTTAILMAAPMVGPCYFPESLVIDLMHAGEAVLSAIPIPELSAPSEDGSDGTGVESP